MPPIKRQLILLAICIGVTMLPMIFTATYTALPAIGKNLGASVTELQWIMNIYGVAICSTLVIAGRLADIYGRKRVYLIGIGLFVIAMLGDDLAPHVGWIIFFQTILGIAGAILIPVAQGIIANAFPGEERSKAIGTLMAFVGLGMAAGPMLGGLIVDLLGWRWLFLLTVPVTLLSAIPVFIFTPESTSGEQAPRIDWHGAALLALCIAAFVVAVMQGSLWNPLLIIALYVISGLSLLFLLRIEKKVATPILQEDLFKNRTFLTASIANLCLLGFLWSGLFLLPLFLQNLHHYSAAEAGLITLFITAPIAICSFISGQLYNKFGPKLLISAGLISLLISAIIQMSFHPETAFIILAIGTLAFGIGMGLAWSSSVNAAMATIPQENIGAGSGTFFTLQEIGGTVGLAITGTVVRLHSDLLGGYQNGMWVLVLICVIGLSATLFMKPKLKI
jgi:EmrB/QacA subfamily drug resistance transporter